MTGDSDITFLLVPGAGGDAWCWHRLIPELAARGHHAVAVELPDRPFADPWPLDEWPDVPTRVIASTGDRFFPADFQQRVARDRVGIEPEPVPGGHLVALSRPTELAHLLLG